MQLLKQSGVLEEDRKIEVSKRIKIVSWIFGISLMLWVISNTAWVFLGVSIYYIGVASMIFGSCLSLHIAKFLPKWITTIGILISLNNLIDELFFDPTEINFNEYLVFSTAIIFICIKKNKQTNNRQNDKGNI